MKRIVALAMLTLSFVTQAQVQVKGYYKSNGTYVQPHIRSSPDSTKTNNYGSAKSSFEYSSEGGYASPSTRDSDKDGISNQNDYDDDNDGISDDEE